MKDLLFGWFLKPEIQQTPLDRNNYSYFFSNFNLFIHR